MARIRSIKPDFWIDDKIAGLPKATALFFIALWTFAEDSGVVSINPRTLSLQVPIFRSQDVHKMVKALWKAGLIECSPGDELALIKGWRHQRIDRPRDGKFKPSEIKWVTWSDSTMIREESTQGEDRRGKDKIGEERKLPRGAQLPLGGVDQPRQLSPKREAPTNAIWHAYAAEYQKRYGEPPVRNGSVNGQLANILARIGAEEAPAVAAFYVTHNESFYVRAMHPVGLLQKDAEKLRTEWKTGRRMTGTSARANEATDHAADQIARIARGEL